MPFPPASTGRSRHAGIICDAVYKWHSEGLPDHNPVGYLYVAGWRCGASCEAGVSGITSTDDGTTRTFHITAWLQAWFGAGTGGTPEINVSGVTDVGLPHGPAYQVNITDIGASAEGTNSYDLTEAEDGAAPYEVCGDETRALAAAADIGIEIVKPIDTNGDGIPDDFETVYSGTIHLTGSWSETATAHGTFAEYPHFIEAKAWDSVSGGIAVSCPGISHTQAFSETAGGASVSGTQALVTLNGESIIDGLGTLHPRAREATLLLHAEPDWAIEATAQARYYGGDPFPGAELEYRMGAAVIDAAATDAAGQATLRYPGGSYYGSGLTAWISYALGDGAPSPTGSSGDNGQHLASYQGQVRVQEAWADAYGAYLASGIGMDRAMGLYCMPRFSAGELDLAASHAFRLFGGLTNWSTFPDPYAGGSFSMDGGIWRWDATAPSGIAFWGKPWLPLLFRYYTLRVKSDTPGARLTISARLYETTSGGSDYYASGEWDVTVGAAGVYEDHRIDWLFPDRMTSQVRASGGFPQRYPFHPYLCQQRYETASEAVHLTLQFRTAGAAYWIESLMGARRSDGTRVPATLHAPLQAVSPGTAPLIPSGAPQDTALNTYDQWPGNLIGSQRGGPIWGWLVANAALGMRFLPRTAAQITGTVKAAWDDCQALYDDAANDTGLTVTPSGDALAARNSHLTSYLAAGDGATLPQALDSPGYGYGANAIDLSCVRRLAAMYGYYGMGASYQNGAYGATLEYQGDLWFDSELTALAWKGAGSVPGVSIDVLDNDTAAVLDTASTDDDGLFAASLKYGVRLPYSNEPRASAVEADHRQYTDHGFAPPDYTAAGKLLNSYWLRSDRFRYRDGGNVVEYSPNTPPSHNFAPHRQDFSVLPRYPSHFDLEVRPGVSHSPDNLTDALGRFHRADVEDGQVIYRRADFNTPAGGAWVAEFECGDGTSEPSLAIDGQELALRACVVYAREDGVYERVSDSDGEDFEAEALMIPGGTHPRTITNPYTQERLTIAYQPGAPGTLEAVYQGPGDTAWSGVFTLKDGAGADLQVEDDSFGITVNHEPGTGLIRWELSLVIAGETEPSEWVSDDEPDWASPAMSWERVT